MQARNLLITGATGFIGRRLVPLLAAEGHRLRLLARKPQDSLAQEHPGTASSPEVCIGTLPDARLAQILCDGIDVVIHTAGLAHVTAGEAALRSVNLDATLQLAQAAKAQGAKRFIFLSSSKARYPAHSRYAALKAEAETALRALHEDGVFEVVCLRPALVYGPGMRGNLGALLRMLTRRQLPAFPSSKQQLGMISVDDLCRAMSEAVQQDAFPDRIWELSDGHEYTLDGLVREVRGALKLPPPLLRVPRLLCKLACGLASLTGGSLSLSTYRTLYEEHYEYDAAFSRHTGFAPQDRFLACLPGLLDNSRP